MDIPVPQKKNIHAIVMEKIGTNELVESNVQY